MTRHSVLRWESMQNLINDENLMRLCELLHVAPEEQEALKSRTLSLPMGETLGERSVEDMAHIWQEVHTSDSALRDLYAMALKRRLRGLTESSLGAARLLGQIEEQHGVWLHLQIGLKRRVSALRERCCSWNKTALFNSIGQKR